MKNNLFVVIIAALLVWLGGCQKPEELLPSVSRNGVNSITANFEDGTGEFVGVLEEGSNEIIVPVPYYYPVSSTNRITEEHLKRMRVKANLDDNVVLVDPILYMDLSKDNKITIIDQLKQRKEITVRGEIRKSNAAQIEEFKLPSLGLSGVINENAKTISLISVSDIDPALAEVTLSYHATISPDPTEVVLDYNSEVELTVTAHDGVTKNVYTVKKEIPDKLPYGIRSGSGKLMFAKRLQADLGISVLNNTGGIAVTGDYVVLNTRDQNSIYINAKTGEKVGEIDLGPVKGSATNFYNTADDDGNILINNLTPNNGNIFKVWALASVNDSPVSFIEWDAAGLALGRKLSIQGSINGDAIITAPILVSTGTENRFARWTVVGGVLTSQTPDILTVTGLTKGWTINADIIYTSANDVNSDYFVASYSDNTFAWVSGATNEVRKKLDEIELNYIPNAVDYVSFNKANYTTLNWVNSFTWGSSDAVWLLDVSSDNDFKGSLQHKTTPAVVWESERGTYGRSATGEAANGNGTGDVALRVSPDGFYLYLYFMFTNGYVVGYQFDCIQM